MTLAALSRRTLTRLTAAAAGTVLLLSGCTDLGGEQESPSASEEESGAGQHAPGEQADLPLDDLGTSAAQDLPSDPASDPAYAEYYEQDIEWGPCEDLMAEDAECGTITVPLAWDDPSQGDIEIAVGRLAGSEQDAGSLVVNPGGPGGSGVDFLESVPYLFSPEVRSAYDVVGFDPRGVSRSAGIECLSDEETDQYRAETAEPGTAEAEEMSQKWGAKIAEACEANSGDVLPYLDTYSTARDMDVLRAALDSEKLDYFGYSYGTYLGSTYADLYADRVGHFVLDGAIDPTITMDELTAGQAEGFEKATSAFVEDCLENADSCPLKGDVEEGKQQLQAFFAAVDENPLDTGDPDRPLTGALARSAVLMLMYGDELWPTGRDALTAGMNGDGEALLNLADQSAGRQDDGSYRTNATYAITAINCLDHPGIADEQWQEQEAERLAEEFPTFGPVMGGDGCAQWPVPPLREPAPISAEGADPILVIGTTGDPATPYEWSVGLAEQLDSGVHMTFEGNGHTAYGRSGGCIEEQVDAYLLEDTVPEDGFTC
ncbi:alpha/beta hydrolase [Brachybacterium fresconis]|uniref:Pimeloyl-ACP methyl ester carboxylesterase n=1 Tax=Brachybacterium fresconis TaxID=173363 RepID=A0ABS4YIV1_9MICO|nr:alpha/beta hydrolase [Brachybacterium fresconis]MBP2408723.1 pimeloyl-ACP methyl ester carboxylesterase [Brachybacterium fresconis]